MLQLPQRLFRYFTAAPLLYNPVISSNRGSSVFNAAESSSPYTLRKNSLRFSSVSDGGTDSKAVVVSPSKLIE